MVSGATANLRYGELQYTISKRFLRREIDIGYDLLQLFFKVRDDDCIITCVFIRRVR